jgi:predicted nucleic acid-binding protein
MNYLLDTNIILIYSRDSLLYNAIQSKYQLFDNGNKLTVSVVTLGELDGLIKKSKIGLKRQNKIQKMLNEAITLDINDEAIIKRYGDIDTFSQGKLDKKSKFSARNMGKNDIWIAATASVYDLTLMTTDKDFDHLKDEFINLEYIDIEQFR